MSALSIRLCIKILSCMGDLPELDSDETARVSGAMSPDGVWRWYKTAQNHKTLPAGIIKRAPAT